MHWSGRIQLALDAGLKTARSARAGHRHGAGAVLLAGSHVVYPTKIRESGVRSYLEAGPIHRSFWRTIEWRLWKPMVNGLERPLADVGCGDGEFGKALFPQIDFGFDGEAATLGHCDPQVYLQTGLTDIREELPVPPGSLATIFSNSVLEHIDHVERALQRFAFALRPGGVLVFTVPSSGLIRAFSTVYGRAFCDRLNGVLGHRNLWTATEWTSKLTAAGFRDVATRGYMTDAAAQWFASRHLPPWTQINRRARVAAWKWQLPRFLDLVDESLEETEEKRTACLFVRALR